MQIAECPVCRRIAGIAEYPIAEGITVPVGCPRCLAEHFPFLMLVGKVTAVNEPTHEDCFTGSLLNLAGALREANELEQVGSRPAEVPVRVPIERSGDRSARLASTESEPSPAWRAR